MRRLRFFIGLLLVLLPEASNDCAELRLQCDFFFLFGLRRRFESFIEFLLVLPPEASFGCCTPCFGIGFGIGPSIVAQLGTLEPKRLGHRVDE